MTPTQITYLVFGIVLLVSLVIDFGLFSKKHQKVSMKSAFWQSMFWIGISLAFFAFVWFEDGHDPAIKYITAYVMEKSLSIDNIFVFILIFSFFKISEFETGRALLIGILLAIVFRIIFIAVGIELIDRFHWLLYVFGAFLLYTGIKLFFKKEEEEFDPAESKIYKWLKKIFPIANQYPEGKYFLKQNNKLHLTTLSLVVVMLAATDIVFAVDSIPTVVSLVREDPKIPFSDTDIMVIYSSNIFAVLGLRALFFLLKGAVSKFDYLQQGIAIVLAFIGVKMLLEIFHIKIPIYISLAFILFCLFASISYSMFVKRKGVPEDEADTSFEE